MAGILLALATPGLADAETFAEPATVFYGKVLGTGAGHPFLVTEGELRWTIRKADGSDLALRAPLYPLNGGEYSYRLDVPHTALGPGLLAGDGKGIPLPITARTHSHLQVVVNGKTARLVGPQGASFDADQARRAGTYRLDLEIQLEAVDTDGDGLPDWWEDANGLDSQDGGDATGDPDGDGRSNLAEFLAGSNPQEDSSAPTLLTTEILANGRGLSGVLLQVDDADSLPGELTFTVEATPQHGQLFVRNAVANPSGPDQVVLPGNQFTLAAVQAGRLVYRPADGTDSLYDRFLVRVRDEDPSHPADSGEVKVHLFHPSQLDLENVPEEREVLLALGAGYLGAQMQSYLLGRDHGYITWMLSQVPRPVVLAAPTAGVDAAHLEDWRVRYGDERPHLFLGSPAADELTGGTAEDLLVGGAGDDRLAGGPGADVFAWRSADDGHDTVVDFASSEGDRLLLAELLAGVQGWADEYLALVEDGEDAILEVRLPGEAVEAPGVSIRLAGEGRSKWSLRSLVASGALELGEIEMMPLVSLTTLAAASENGPVPGLVRVSREGALGEPLVVYLRMAGSATNGVDYSLLDEVVTIPAGEAVTDIEVRPFADAITEPLEIAEFFVIDDPNYEIASLRGSAQVPIEDLRSELWLEVVRANGFESSGLPALLLLRRQHLVERSLFLRLSYSGTASPGEHFMAPEFVNLLPGQTSELLAIQPLPGAELPGGVGSVVVEIVEDPSFAVKEPRWAELVLSSEEERFDLWVERHFGRAEGELSQMAGRDPGRFGLTLLERYAFGLDPEAPLRDRDRLPAISVDEDGRLRLEFHRSSASRDLVYTLEMSPDLENWQPAAGQFERLPAPWLEGSPGRTLYRSLDPVDSRDRTFLRIRTRLQP